MDELPKNVVPITSKASQELASFGSEHGLQLLTILFTDLVDSTKLQGELGNVESARLTELHRKLVGGLLAQYDAKEIEWAGDSCLAVFTKPSDGVVFALRLQAAIREAQQNEPKLPSVRIGLHLGEIVVRHHDNGVKDDLFGLQVSEAARIMSLARGGQVYCSRAVFDNARSSLTGRTVPGIASIAYINHGPFILKGVPDPVDICEVLDADLVRPKAPEANDKCRPAGWGARVTARPKSVIGIAVAAVALLVAGLVALPRSRTAEPATRAGEFSGAEPKPVRRLALNLAPQYPLAWPSVADTSLALSPDGQLMAYLAQTGESRRLAVQRIGEELQPHLVIGDYDVDRPFFSPDGEWIGFLGNDDGWKVLRVPSRGGTPVPVVDVQLNLPAAWGEDGNIYYTPTYGYGIRRIPAFGGESDEITTPDQEGVTHTFPLPLPGDQGIVYTRITAPTVDAARVEVLDYRTNETRVLVEKAGAGAYLPTGHLLYAQYGRLMAAAFDPATLTFTGAHFDATDERMTDPEEAPTRVAVSKSGTFVYVPSGLGTADHIVMTWLYLDGRTRDVDLPAGVYLYPRISPDGQSAAFIHEESNVDNIWIRDLERETQRRFTDTLANSTDPLWTPDGRTLFFRSDRSGKWGIYSKPIGTSSNATKYIESPDEPATPKALTSDGKTLVYTYRRDLYSLTLDGSNTSRPLVQSRFWEGDPSLSPDDRWMSYTSNESGRPEVYIRSFPDMGPPLQVSTEGARWSHWTRDGRLRYVTSVSPRSVMEVILEEDGGIGAPRPLLMLEPEQWAGGSMHRDGDRYLTVKTLGSDTVRVGGTQVVVVENWFEELKKLEPLER